MCKLSFATFSLAVLAVACSSTSVNNVNGDSSTGGASAQTTVGTAGNQTGGATSGGTSAAST
ncbi:MAG TPA: hypothetical protein VIV60_19470, partial [Polyangiaceae bacterium]